MHSPFALDDLDRRILNQLQTDCSLTNQALAEKVHASAPTCLRRVRRLVDAGIFVGHIRTVTDFPRLWAALSLTPADVDRLSGLIGGAVGDLALACGLYLLARRLVLPRLRQITRFEDFFALVLLLAVLASGQALRFGPPVDLAPVRDYLAALATFSPRPMPDIPGFAAHFLLVQALAVYAPFGKLMHIAGVFPAKAGLADAG